MLAKIDLKKAYNRIEWSFVDKALEAWGFSREVQLLVFNCVLTVKFEILVNGRMTDKVYLAKRL